MFRYLIIFIGLSLSLVACSSPHVKWSYGHGSNIDELVITKVVFNRESAMGNAVKTGDNDTCTVTIHQHQSCRGHQPSRLMVCHRPGKAILWLRTDTAELSAPVHPASLLTASPPRAQGTPLAVAAY